MRKHIITVAVALGLIGFIALAVTNIQRTKTKLKFEQVEIKSNEAKLIELNIKYDQLLQQKTSTDAEKQEQLKKIQDLENERKRLEGELQAKLDRESADRQKVAVAAQNASGSTKASAAAGCNTGNQYKDFIYSHESGCRPEAVNSIGCRGIGQACPGSKLPCGADFACQDAYFTNYAMARYGSWEAAYRFWVANRWW